MNTEGEIILYQSENSTQVEVRIENETVWLTLNQMSELFERDKSVISRHIRNIFDENELERNSVVAKNATVQLEGGKEWFTFSKIELDATEMIRKIQNN